MAILLGYDKDNTHPDPEKEYRGCYRKGYVVEVFENDKPYVNPPQPPFFILSIPELTKAQVENYMGQWQRAITYNVLQRSVPLDGWRLEIKATNANVSGKGHLTRAKVEEYIVNWGGQIVNVVKNGVRFDISIFSIVKSRNFWGRDVTPIVFAEVSYDQGTGVHRVSANYNAVPFPPGMTMEAFEKMFSDAVTDKDGTVVSNTGGAVVFDIGRDVVIQRVRDELQEHSEETICRRQKYLDPAFVDAIIANGRVMTATAAQVLGYVRDRLVE